MDKFVILFIVGVSIAAAVVTGLKGKPWLLLIGFLIGWSWVFGSLGLAKPQSWWARSFYDSVKMSESCSRFGGSPKAAFKYPPRVKWTPPEA